MAAGALFSLPTTQLDDYVIDEGILVYENNYAHPVADNSAWSETEPFKT